MWKKLTKDDYPREPGLYWVTGNEFGEAIIFVEGDGHYTDYCWQCIDENGGGLTRDLHFCHDKYYTIPFESPKDEEELIMDYEKIKDEFIKEIKARALNHFKNERAHYFIEQYEDTDPSIRRQYFEALCEVLVILSDIIQEEGVNYDN